MTLAIRSPLNLNPVTPVSKVWRFWGVSMVFLSNTTMPVKIAAVSVLVQNALKCIGQEWDVPAASYFAGPTPVQLVKLTVKLNVFVMGVVSTMLKILTGKAWYVLSAMRRLAAWMVTSVLCGVLYLLSWRGWRLSFMIFACKKQGCVPNYGCAMHLDNASSWEFEGDDSLCQWVYSDFCREAF